MFEFDSYRIPKLQTHLLNLIYFLPNQTFCPPFYVIGFQTKTKPMIRTTIFVSTILLLFSGLSSCVSQQKFMDMESLKNSLEQRLTAAQEDLEQRDKEVAELRNQLRINEQAQKQLTMDLERSRQQYDELDKTNKNLLERYDRILAQNQQNLAQAGNENASLMTRLTEKENALNQKELELKALQAQLGVDQGRQRQLEEALKAREARVAELEKAIADKDARLAAIRERVNQALRGFSESDLTVREKNGKVYVSLSQNLLFASGSKTINTQGRQAIKQLAGVLNVNPDINITVEGHTDTDGDAAFNWDLSVGRATTIVKELTNNGVAPERIIAAGRGEYFPVAPNTTTQGKAQNRRTEIILTPKLDVLYDLLGQ
jgi:chemotaxis protein MotB